MRKLLLATAALVALASPAAAGGDGRYWLNECSKASATCRGYIAGVADSARPCGMMEVVETGRSIASAEMQAAVVRYLRNIHPGRLDMRGNALVLEALEANWPCRALSARRAEPAPTPTPAASTGTGLSPQDALEGIAIMAEYLTSCEDEAKPDTVRNMQNIIRRVDYSQWLKTASKFHIVRTERELLEFCDKVQGAFQHMLMPPDFGPRDASKIKPPPGDLNLNPLARRIP